MTVRNLRAHQSRGLLPAPEVRGRTGYYGPEHVARVELIRELQGEGFNLEAIRRLLEGSAGGGGGGPRVRRARPGGSPAGGGEALRSPRPPREPFEDEQPEIVTAEELAEQFGGTDPELLERAEELGLLLPLGEGRYEQPGPRLARAGAEIVRLGVPAADALELVSRIRRHADAVAHRF